MPTKAQTLQTTFSTRKRNSARTFLELRVSITKIFYLTEPKSGEGRLGHLAVRLKSRCLKNNTLFLLYASQPCILTKMSSQATKIYRKYRRWSRSTTSKTNKIYPGTTVLSLLKIYTTSFMLNFGALNLSLQV